MLIVANQNLKIFWIANNSVLRETLLNLSLSEIIAANPGMSHDKYNEKCLAWVEKFMDDSSRIEKNEYYLCALTPSFRRLGKEIASYNPYFGISVESMQYKNGIVTLKYHDKHNDRQMELDENNSAFNFVVK